MDNRDKNYDNSVVLAHFEAEKYLELFAIFEPLKENNVLPLTDLYDFFTNSLLPDMTVLEYELMSLFRKNSRKRLNINFPLDEYDMETKNVRNNLHMVRDFSKAHRIINNTKKVYGTNKLLGKLKKDTNLYVYYDHEISIIIGSDLYLRHFFHETKFGIDNFEWLDSYKERLIDAYKVLPYLVISKESSPELKLSDEMGIITKTPYRIDRIVKKAGLEGSTVYYLLVLLQNISSTSIMVNYFLDDYSIGYSNNLMFLSKLLSSKYTHSIDSLRNLLKQINQDDKNSILERFNAYNIDVDELTNYKFPELLRNTLHFNNYNYNYDVIDEIAKISVEEIFLKRTRCKDFYELNDHYIKMNTYLCDLGSVLSTFFPMRQN